MLVICSMQICLQMFHLGEVTNYLHLSPWRQAFQSWARNEIEERSYSNQFSVVFETEPINLELHCKHFMNCDQWTAVSLLNGLTRNPVFSKLSFTRVSEMGKSHLQTPVQTSPLAILHVNWPPGLLSSFQVLTDVHANRIGSSLKMCRNCVE